MLRAGLESVRSETGMACATVGMLSSAALRVDVLQHQCVVPIRGVHLDIHNDASRGQQLPILALLEPTVVLDAVRTR